MKASGTCVYAVAAVAGALLLSGCGGSGDDDVEDQPGAASAEEETGSSDTDAPGGDTIEVEPRTLTYASFVPRDNDASDAMEELMERVVERTGGAIEFDTFYDGSLCAPAEISDCVSDGRADIGYTSSLYTPSAFPFTTVGNVPFQSSNVSAVVQTMNRLYGEGTAVRDEFEALGQELIYFGPVDLTLLAMTEEVTSIDDLDGRSVRATGDIANALEDLGMTAVAVDTSEQYEAMQRGVVDGSAQTFAGHSLYRHYEVASYFYDLGEYSGNYGTMHTVVNADLMADLEPELQELIREIAADISLRLESDFLTPYSEKFCTDILDGGGQFSSLPDPEAFSQWQSEQAETAMANWVAAQESPDASEFADEFLAMLDELEGQFDYRSGADICSEILKSRN